jgi:small-conductance mechanosensitive channel/CRP-like cAMP-binding protein
MIDFSTATEIVARRPLVLLLGIFVLGGAATHFLFKKYPIGRAVIRVIFLILLTIALLYRDILPYRPLKLTETPFLDAVHVVLKIAWWLYAAWFLVGVLRAALVFRGSPRETKLLQDVLAGLIYVAAVFAIVAYVFDLPVQGLLATSGAVAIILGLALQSTLGDVFSGVVLSFSRPYRPGDWISLEGGTDGRVIEINWRATYVLTGRRDLAIVPNSTIAKSKIVNVSSPSGIHGATVAVQLDAKTPPAIGIEILEHALLNCKLILATPAPTITIKTVNASYTEFEVTLFVEELTSATKAQNEFFDAMYRHLAVSGVDLAPPQDQRDRTADGQALQPAKTRPEKLLELVAIFATLTSDERATIATKLKEKVYDKGEILVDPGTVLQSLFVIGAGVLSIIRNEPIEGEMEVTRLGPGDYFGLIGMLTGAPATGKITALTPVTIYELAKGDLAPLLEARPQVSQELCRALARRQAAGRSDTTDEIAATVPAHRLTSWFSDRLHRLYDIPNAERASRSPLLAEAHPDPMPL